MTIEFVFGKQCVIIVDMKFVEVEIKNAPKKQKLSAYLAANGFGRAYLKMLSEKSGRIFLDQKPTTLAEIVKDNQKYLLATCKEDESSLFPFSNKPIEIAYEDDNILVIKKPRGLATMPTRKHIDDNLAARIGAYFESKGICEKVRILTRLDRDVEGLVLVAKSYYAASYFAHHPQNLKKTYVATLCGRVDEKIVCTEPIKTTKNHLGIINQKRVCASDGKPSTTIFEPICYDKTQNTTKCFVQILSGRTHQIRVHSAHIGHAIVGDTLYGGRENDCFGLCCKKLEIVCPPLSINLSLEF